MDLSSTLDADVLSKTGSVIAYWLLTGLTASCVLWVAVRVLRARAGLGAVEGGPGVTVVSGKVEPLPDAPRDQAPMVVEIDQQGANYAGKNKHHVWREVARRVTLHPFYVVQGSGERVLVEPDDTVDFIDLLQKSGETGERMKRTRVARLTAGEQVTCVGELSRPMASGGGAYRAGAAGTPTLRRGRRRLVVTTRPLGEHHQASSKTGTRLLAMLAAALVVVGLVAPAPYLALELRGKVVEAHVTGFWVTWHQSKSKSFSKHHLEAIVPAGTLGPEPLTVSGTVPLAVFERFAGPKGTWSWPPGKQRVLLPVPMPFVVDTGRPSHHQPGQHPGLHSMSAGIMFALTLLSLIATIATRGSDWHQGGKLVERGSGWI